MTTKSKHRNLRLTAIVFAGVLSFSIPIVCSANAIGNDNNETVDQAVGIQAVETDSNFTGGSGTAEDPYQISTAEELDRIHDHLTENFILISDIDLSGYENWIPIGEFQSKSDKPEDAEVPKPEVAFSGTFDGNGHAIKNVNVNAPQSMAAGLFGCVMGTDDKAAYIRNLTVENVNVNGAFLVGGVVGLQFMNCTVEEISLRGKNVVQGMQGVGGIVGTSFDWIRNCDAVADITVLGEGGACAGIIAGGTTFSSISGCTAEGGSISAADNGIWGIGGICGAPYGAAEIADCEVKDVAIAVTGENNRLVGGLAGFAGTYQEGTSAKISDCKVSNVTIQVSDSTTCVGGILGGGKEESEDSDRISSFEILDCEVSGSITGGADFVGNAVGNEDGAVEIDCTGKMING
ncbi:MAG: GLUG motif-containing protein [Lachnospiraceae bacterium]|nr:GLUG motif-containing protein [Lachnospiraceae bacterium]